MERPPIRRQLTPQAFTDKITLHVESNVPATIVLPMQQVAIDEAEILDKHRIETGVAQPLQDFHWSQVEQGAFTTSFNNCEQNAHWVFVKLTDGRKPLVGVALLSPLSPTTLPQEARRMLGIAENSIEYAFLAPAAQVREEPLRRPAASSSKSVSHGRRSVRNLIENGGFVYFDAGGEVTHVNAISDKTSGWRMEFYDAKELSSRPVVGILAAQGRLSKVTG